MRIHNMRPAKAHLGHAIALSLVLGTFGLAGTTAHARPADDAAACLLADADPALLKTFEKLDEENYKPTRSELTAFNGRMLACERSQGWTRRKTFAAGSHAGFVVRYRMAEKDYAARGVSAARRAELRRGAALFEAGPVRRDTWDAFRPWLREHVGTTFAAFRAGSEFAYFDAYTALLSSAHTFESAQ